MLNFLEKSFPIKTKFENVFFPNDYKTYHVKSLDGLRGLAILLVLLSHSGLLGLFFHPLLDFRYTGTYGVYLFFILSAYLLDGQIWNAYFTGTINRRFWYNYFLRRFLRIYPLFIIVVISNYYLTLNGFQKFSINLSEEDILSHFLLVEGKHILWSIPVEFKYYFISPLIVFFSYKFFNNEVYKTGLFFIGIAIFGFLATRYNVLTYFNTFAYIQLFLAGTFVAFIDKLEKNKLPKWLLFFNTNISTASILSIIVILLTFKILWAKIFHTNVFPFHDSKFHALYAATWGILLYALLIKTIWLRKIFEFKLLRYFGVISYSLYLLHIPVLYFVAKTNIIPEKLKIYGFFFLTIVIASMSYYLIEKPLSKIRINYKKD